MTTLTKQEMAVKLREEADCWDGEGIMISHQDAQLRMRDLLNEAAEVLERAEH